MAWGGGVTAIFTMFELGGLPLLIICLDRHHRPPHGGGGYKPPYKPPPSSGLGAPNIFKVLLLAYVTSLAIGLHIINTNVNITELSKSCTECFIYKVFFTTIY